MGAFYKQNKRLKGMEQNLLKSNDITMKKKQRKPQRDINDSKQTLLASFFTNKN